MVNRFDYTQVSPESNTGYKYEFGKDQKPYVKGRPYDEGQDFYPDRIIRDERTAVRQFWDSPHLGPEIRAEVDALPSGKKGQYQQEREKSDFIKKLRNIELRSRGTESRFHPGAITTEDDPYLGLAGLLAQSRADQFAKYAPTYGMSEKEKKRFLAGGPQSKLYGYKYGDEDAAKVTEGRYWKDYGKEALRTMLGDIGWVTDVGGKGLSQTLWPFDFEGPEGTLPRGWKDLAEYTNLMALFNEAAGGATEEQWKKLGYSEKEDIKKAFKDMTDSKWDYDPTYHPLTEESGFRDLLESFSEEYLTPSSDYLDIAAEITNPFAFETTKDKTFDWTPLNTAEILGTAATGIGSVAAAKKFMKTIGPKFAPLIPQIIKKYPKIATLLGLSTPSAIAGFVE
jgi:hypothetical protein